MMAAFLFFSAGFCSGNDSADDDGHCFACCSAGCCAVVLQEKNIASPFLDLALYIPFNTALRQELIIRDIEYPPKAIL